MPANHTLASATASAPRGRVDFLAACGLLAAASGAIAALAWTSPTSAASTVAYTQSGHLAYSATVPAGSIYGPGGLHTGQPVYTDVVKALRLNFTYDFSSTAAARLSGTTQIAATIGNGQGINRTIVLRPATHFLGRHVVLSTTLRLSRLEAMARAFQIEAPNQGLGIAYPVTIFPLVSVHGWLGRSPLQARFQPQIGFALSSSTFVVQASAAANSSVPGQPTATTLSPRTTGAITLPAAAPAYLLGSALKVAQARVGALVVLALAILVGGILGRRLFRDIRTAQEPDRIAARYSSLLVQAAPVIAGLGSVVVDLSSFAGLLQVAKRLECPILHSVEDGDVYTVVDNSTLYRYRTASANGVPAVGTEVPKEQGLVDLVLDGRPL